MRVTEPQLRTVTLAQAIELADTQRTLVSPPELDDALQAALAAARARGVVRVGVGDIVLDRAAAIVQRASGRDATVAALQEPGARLRWLAVALPVAALLLGLAIDRIANTHRVDLLSPPLLAVLAWNLAMYLLLAWRAWPRPGRRAPQGAPAGSTWWGALRRWGHWGRFAPDGRAGPRGLAARIAARFHTLWLARTADLFTQRAARVLHLCAAAWAAGIALSLLLRGLVVRYQFGWESTFLDAGQVHTIVAVLFWPLTALFGLAPFSAQEIAATQNFGGEGAAGSRWVWMYVGLLALVVVLPRLALAAGARWREARLARQCTLDLHDGTLDALRQALPGDIVVGVRGTSDAHLQAWRGIVASHAVSSGPGGIAALQTAQGDRLCFTEDSAAPVDVVLCWDGTPDAGTGSPAWQEAPRVALRWSEAGASWVREPVLFERLWAALPAQQTALSRLQGVWQAANEARFAQALAAVTEHLRACALLGSGSSATGPTPHAARYAQLVQALDDTLSALHPGAVPVSAAHPSPPLQWPAATHRLPASRTTENAALALGTTAGAAAGAAAGAKVGALVDLGTGGMTLGAGTALGATLGGATAWLLGRLRRQGAANGLLQHMTEAACIHYLVIAHQSRVSDAESPGLAGRWDAEVTGTVAAHWDALAAALQAPGAPPAALQSLLDGMLRGILQRSISPGPATPQ